MYCHPYPSQHFKNNSSVTVPLFSCSIYSSVIFISTQTCCSKSSHKNLHCFTIRHHLTPDRMAIIKKSTNNKRWRGCGEKGTLLHCWWECKLVQPLWKTVWRFLKKLKIELPYDPAIPLLGIDLDKTLIRKDTCTPVFIAALFTIAKTWKQPKCPSTDE